MRTTAIKERRINNELSIEDVSEKLNISKSMIYKIEKGLRIPSILLAVRIAILYGCPTDDIFKDLGITG